MGGFFLFWKKCNIKNYRQLESLKQISFGKLIFFNTDFWGIFLIAEFSMEHVEITWTLQAALIMKCLACMFISYFSREKKIVFRQNLLEDWICVL